MQDLADTYANALGGWSGLSALLASNVRKAAELTALAEQTRADALRDGTFDPLALVRLEGASSRAVRALALDVPREPASTSLADYLDDGDEG
jgi:hypothetical protein